MGQGACAGGKGGGRRGRLSLLARPVRGAARWRLPPATAAGSSRVAAVRPAEESLRRVRSRRSLAWRGLGSSGGCAGAAYHRARRDPARSLQMLPSFPWSFGLRRSRCGFASAAPPRSQARPDTELYKVPWAWFSGAARLRAPLGFCSVPCSGARPPLLPPRPFCSRAPSKSRR